MSDYEGTNAGRLSLHKRLRDLRDASVRRPQMRPVYSHAVTSAHLNGHLTTDDHPSWVKIRQAIAEARAGDLDALDTVEREIARLFPDKVSGR